MSAPCRIALTQVNAFPSCLRAHGVQDVYVLGVFAEGCVRSTVVDVVKRGYTVHAIADAVASNAAWKKAFALWAMDRAEAEILTRVVVKPGGPGEQPQWMAAEIQHRRLHSASQAWMLVVAGSRFGSGG